MFLGSRQAEMSDRPGHILRNLSRRPAGYLFDGSGRAVSGLDREPEIVARIVEVHELLQTLDVAIMEELLLEVGAWGLGGWTLWRRERHIARRRDLHFAVDNCRDLSPTHVRIVIGAAAASHE